MAISLDFWRTVQRLRIDADRRGRAHARIAREAAMRRRSRSKPQGRSWRLAALYLLALAAPAMAALAVSPPGSLGALRSNARFLLGMAIGEAPRAEPSACPGGRSAEATALLAKVGPCERRSADR